MLETGRLVRHKDTNRILGYVAGLYSPLEYPNVYSIILIPKDIENLSNKWFWNRWHGEEHPLNNLCKDHWVYNYREKDLKYAKTLLGNEL